jgi:hypothetical protein
MGLFSKIKTMAGGVDNDLMEHGLLGRGVLTDIKLTGAAVTMGVDEYRVCELTVEVTLDRTPTFTAQCRQRIPIYALGQLQPGATVMAVRVDPNDHTKVAVDLHTEPPVVQMAAGEGALRASDVLARGVPVQAVIVQTEPLGMTNDAGVDLHAFVLTVMPEGGQPYQAKVGNPVPAAALPLLYPGSHVPAKVMPGSPDGVVIDWEAALAR